MIIENIGNEKFYWKVLTSNAKMKPNSKNTVKSKSKSSTAEVHAERRSSNVENELHAKHSSYTTSSEPLFNKRQKRISRLQLNDENGLDSFFAIETPAILQSGEQNHHRNLENIPYFTQKPRKVNPSMGKKGPLYSKLEAQTRMMQKNRNSAMRQRAHMNAPIAVHKRESIKQMNVKSSPAFDFALSVNTSKVGLNSYKIPKKSVRLQSKLKTDNQEVIKEKSNSYKPVPVKQSEKKPTSVKESSEKKLVCAKRLSEKISAPKEGVPVKKVAIEKKSELVEKKSKPVKQKSNCNKKLQEGQQKVTKSKISKKKIHKDKPNVCSEESVQKDNCLKRDNISKNTVSMSTTKEIVPILNNSLSSAMLSPPMSPVSPTEVSRPIKRTFRRVSIISDEDSDDEEFNIRKLKKCRPIESDHEESDSESVALPSPVHRISEKISTIPEDISETNMDIDSDDASIPQCSTEHCENFNTDSVASNSNDNHNFEDEDYENTVNFEDGDNDEENDFRIRVENIESVASLNSDETVQFGDVQFSDKTSHLLQKPVFKTNENSFSSDLFSHSSSNTAEIEIIDIDDDEDDDVVIIEEIKKPDLPCQRTVHELFRRPKVVTQTKIIAKQLEEFLTSPHCNEDETLKIITSESVPVCALCEGKSSLMTCTKCDKIVCRELCEMQHFCAL